jgi:hypothetical protein
MSEVFDGTVDVQDGNGNTTVLMDGTRGSLNVGGGGQDGSIHVDDAAGTGRIFLGADGSITSRDAAAGTVFGLYGDGQIYIRRLLAADYITVFEFLSPQGSLSIGGESTSGSLTLRNTDGDEAAVIDGHEGDVTVSRDIDGTLRDVLTFAGATATLRIGSEDNGGDLILSDSAGRDVLHLEAERAAVFIGAAGNEGDLIVRDGEAARWSISAATRPWSTWAPRATRATCACSMPMATCASISTGPRATSTSLAPTARRISRCAMPPGSSRARCW